MKSSTILRANKAQTAVEYLLLLTTVVAIVLVGLKTYLPVIYEASNIYYNRVVPGIIGQPPRCGDGCCDSFEARDGGSRCPVDCPGPPC